MHFSRIFYAFLSLGVISAAATPAPVAEQKRDLKKRADVTDILSVLDVLQGSTGSILPQIGQ